MILVGTVGSIGFFMFSFILIVGAIRMVMENFPKTKWRR